MRSMYRIVGLGLSTLVVGGVSVAVAQTSSPATQPVIFAASTVLPKALSVAGSGNRLEGVSHSNRDVSVAGAGSSVASLTLLGR
jgi:hypothetical protein